MTIHIIRGYLLINLFQSSEMSQEDSFYMILPSNASPRTHPNNHASDYIVAWENPIYLNPEFKWKVALTEISYIYKPTTLSSSYRIEFSAWQKSIDSGTLVIGQSTNNNFTYSVDNIQRASSKTHYRDQSWPNDDPQSDANFQFKITIIEDRFHIVSPNPFSLDFSNCHNAQELKELLGLSNHKGTMIHCQLEVTYNDFMITGFTKFSDRLTEMMQTADDLDLANLFPGIKAIVYLFSLEKYAFSFPEDKSFLTVIEMVKYLKTGNFQKVFQDVNFNEAKNRMEIKLHDFIQDVHLINGLNYVLGFDDPHVHRFYPVDKYHFLPGSLKRYSTDWVATHPPQLHRGISNMFVYASICKPVYVGHTQVPLLKNVFIDSSNDANEKGSARNYVVINPMYVPVDGSLFNSIEINIRNDSGHIVPFPRGAITSITIHFQRDR